MLENLSKIDSDIKIIHYVRDPRALFLSQRGGKVLPNAVNSSALWANSWCSRLVADYRHVRHLVETVDILQLRYEDLATNFSHAIHKIYKYIKRSIPEELIDWFQTNTNATKSNGPMGTTRTNSTATAYRWRHHLPDTVINTISKYCANVLRIYRYAEK